MKAMCAEGAGQISVSVNCGLTSALHPIAAVRVVGFRQAARDCDFNRSMQRLDSHYREGGVENEAATENLLH